MPRVLGVILPDDGPQDYEWTALDAWLLLREREDVTVRVAGSECDGLHVVSSLFETGSIDRLAPPARRLAEAEGAEALVWACTSGSFIGGLGWARKQAAALRAAAGVPATSTALALLDAIRALGAERVDVLSPYPPDITERFIAFLDEGGIAAADVESLDCLRSSDSHGIDLDGAVAALSGADRPLVIPDTAVDSLSRVAALEARAGRAVVTANQATLWAGLGLLGRPRAVADAGTLFGPCGMSQVGEGVS